jgi:protein-S-isoprenylcysteine O-methyltransferase Ste14
LKKKLLDLAASLPLIAWYGWNASKGLPVFLREASTLARGGGTALDFANLAALFSSTVFCGFLVAVLVARMPPRSTAFAWAPRAWAVLGTFAAVGFQSLPPARLSTAWAIASSVLVCAGFGLSLAVLAALGRSFSIVPEARRLVVGGPYALCRHPLYLVEQTALLGVALQHTQPWGGLLLAVQFAVQLVRIRYEERVLSDAFPEDYAAYAARTARLVPGVY